MDQLAIHIKIFDQDYKIQASPDEEIFVREAGKLIQERVGFHRQTKAGILDQAVMAKITLECVVATLKGNAQIQQFQDRVSDKIAQLDTVISSAIGQRFD